MGMTRVTPVIGSVTIGVSTVFGNDRGTFARYSIADLGPTSDGYRAYLAIVHGMITGDTSSGSASNYAYFNGDVLTDAVGATTVRTDAIGPLWMPNMTNWDLIGYGMAVLLGTDRLIRCGRFYTVNGDYGAWATNAIPPTNFQFELMFEAK